MPSYTIMREDVELRYDVETLASGRYRVTPPDGAPFEIDAYSPEAHHLHLLLDGQAYDADVRLDDTSAAVTIGGARHRVEVLNERQRRMRKAGVGVARPAGPELNSPMAGRVVKIHASVGDVVAAGDVVLVVEAMKMENDLKAHRDGTVSQIAVAEGDTVEVNALLLVIDE